jgi:hypothetical protein
LISLLMPPHIGYHNATNQTELSPARIRKT